MDRLFVPKKAIHETTRNNTNEVSSKFEFSHFDFLRKADRLDELAGGSQLNLMMALSFLCALEGTESEGTISIV